jgi:hypothetical protein
MRTTEEIVHHLREIIARIYVRPEMYAMDVAELDQAMFIYNRMLAFAADMENEFSLGMDDAVASADSGAMGFHTRYLQSHPDASQEEIGEFTLKHWAMVSQRLDVLVAEISRFAPIAWQPPKPLVD